MGDAAGARITALGWGFRYPGRSAVALSDVSFTIEPGELVVLMGASGSGKSTLLAALAGTLPEGGDSGSLVVEGPGAGRASARIGLVQQEPEGNIVMERVGDDVAFPLENAAVPAGRIWSDVAGALDAVGLGVPLDRDTSRLSGGQQQLLAVAAATVADPHLLLLDEPTANLDPASAAAVLAAVEAVRTRLGCTVVVVEHRVEAWLARADRVLLAEGGSVLSLAPGRPGRALRRPARFCGAGLARPRPPAQPHPGGRAGRCRDGGRGPRGGRSAAGHRPRRPRRRGGGGDRPPRLRQVHPAGLPRGSAGALGGDGADRFRGPTARACDPWRWPSPEIASTFGVVFQNPEHQFVTGRVIDEVQHGLAGRRRSRA